VTSALGTPIEGLKLRIKNDPSPALINGLAQ
jgi:hypothetical protein